VGTEIGVLAAFGAGLLSFLSPCVLPLIPGYLSFMTGLSVSELSSERRSVTRVLVPALLFVAGFTVVFVAYGASASVLGQLLLTYRDIAEKIAGIVLIGFGIVLLGIVKVPWLYAEARMDMAATRRFGGGAALVMGMAFAAGWTPCVGPILGSILALAGSSGSVGRGALLLLVYSIGLGLPFVAVALLLGRLGGALRWMGRNGPLLNKIAGALLVLLGGLVFAGRLGLVSTWLTGLFSA
jgi:cytochrome c-type biogenesis protein